METRECQFQRLIPAAHAIERLHSISGSPLHQVVQGSNNHYSLLMSIEFKTDVTIVTSCQNLRLGITVYTVPFFNQAHKRLMLVGFAIESPQNALIDTFFQKSICSN